MTDTKHFNYEGHVDLRTQHDLDAKVEITDVEFLNPARIKLTVNGKETSVMVSVDIINRKVYDQKGHEFRSEEVFAHLDSVNSLPEDFFQAPEEIYDQVEIAEAERIRKSGEFLGEQHE